MSEEERQMAQALATLWDTFIRSPLGIPSNLAAVGLERYSGRSNFNGWDGAGDFHGRSDVWLTRQDGVHFVWTAAVFYEQGSNDGEFFQQGCAYAYTSSVPGGTGANVGLYNIGDVQLPDHRLTFRDLPDFASEIVRLSERCFDDLSFVYQHNLFANLLSLSDQRINGQDQWESNPLRSNQNA